MNIVYAKALGVPQGIPVMTEQKSFSPQTEQGTNSGDWNRGGISQSDLPSL